MDSPSITIRVSGDDLAQAGRFAQELRQTVLDGSPHGVAVSVRAEDPETMQFGETVVVDIVAAALVHGVIESIKLFLHKRKAVLRIEAKGQTVVVDGTKPDPSGQSDQALAHLGQIVHSPKG